ncbi:sensor histidine kinase [Corticibacter populi]|nr:ATP-binding protein [Corticibacter populi]RZS30008.1 two-component system C4-dicarboxylate transport sensor histidine kinase DctB [Corticibacter populi]
MPSSPLPVFPILPPLRRWLLPLLALALTLAAACGAHAWVWRHGLAELRDAGAHRLELLTLDLEATLARFEYLPALLEHAPDVMRLLQHGDDRTLQATVSEHLHHINATAGAELLYLVDRSGLAVAADDAGQPGSPWGTSFAYRPYVQQALAGGRGHFFGIGITTGRPGYYLSYALPRAAQPEHGDAVLGVAVVKIGLSDAEQRWHKLPGEVLVLDENGVAVLSTQGRWRYHPLNPIPDATRAKLDRERSYRTTLGASLPWRPLQDLGPDAQLVRLEETSYLASRRALPSGGLQVLVLEPTGPLRQRALGAGALAAALAAVAFLLLALRYQRQRSLRQRLASQQALQAAHDSLEAEVERRTRQLQQTQRELIQAEKMAALGQMSAGMVHEINQPLAAMRTLADNAQVLLQHDRHADVARNLQRIGTLVQRLAAIAQPLKVFAHKPTAPLQAVPVAQAVQQALAVLEPRLATGGPAAVQVQVDIAPTDLAVQADALRLEQVLVNLIGNAADALQQQPAPRIAIQARADTVGEARQVRIAICDNGPGIAADMLPRLFEPFSTSKPAGVGLGLGLMISEHLAREMGGRLSGENRPAGGACFNLQLPAAT